MKRILLPAAITLALISCSRQGGKQFEPAGTTVSVSIADEGEKTSIAAPDAQGRRMVLWSEGDILGINGEASEPLGAGYEGQAKAAFNFNAVLNAPYDLIYPAAFLTGEENVALPAVQAYAEGTFAPNTALALGRSADASAVTLKNACAAVKVSVIKGTHKAALKYAEFKGNAGEQLCGPFSADFTEAALTGLSTAEEDRCIRLSVGGADEGKDTTDLYFVMPALTFDKGFTVRIVDVHNHFQDITRSSAITLSRGTVAAMKAKEFEPTGTLMDAQTGDLDTPELDDIKEGDPIKVENGQVVFFLHSGGGPAFSGRTITVHGREVTAHTDDYDRVYIRVPESPDGSYSVTTGTSCPNEWNTGSTLWQSLVLPCGQFLDRTPADILDMPHYGSYSPATGNILTLKGPYAFIDVHMGGNAAIASVLAFSNGSKLSGRYDWNKETGTATSRSCVDFASLNCMEAGGAQATRTFRLAVIPGTYENLGIRAVSTSHLKCEKSLGRTTLAAGDVLDVRMTFDPGGNVFFEGFDCFVWGGNPMKGSGSPAFAPDATVPSPRTVINRTGYEYARTAVSACTTYGAAYMHDHDESKTPKDFPLMSDSYLRSRNIAGYDALVRCLEHQGCIVVGPVDSHRGWLTLPSMNIRGMADVVLSFDFCFMAGICDDIDLFVNNAGVVTYAKVDGTDVYPHTEASYRKCPGGRAVLLRSDISAPASPIASKSWHHVEVGIANATSYTSLKWMPRLATAGIHGCYIDNIEVNLVPQTQQNTVRLLFWNILYGMDSDRKNGHNNYDSFVEWIKGYDPDICVFCEARSSGSSNPLPNTYSTLASRYGHSYVAGTGSYYAGSGDGFPQEVTSKYPLTHVKDISFSATVKNTDGTTSTKKSHGGGLVKVDIGGRVINIVPLHLIPGGNVEAGSCDSYQEKEIEAILNETVLNSAYSSQKDWIVLGDFNSQTPIDDWFYTAMSSSGARYKAHSLLRSRTNLIDIVSDRFPRTFTCSTGGNSRIDFVYVSPSIFNDLVSGGVVMDEWAHPQSISQTPGYYPSDHRPLMMVFKK